MTLQAFRVFVPATSANLGPGFDTLGLALTFGNAFDVRPIEGPSRYAMHGEGALQRLTDADNLFWAGARRLALEVGRELPGLDVTVHLEIPLSRGLGSSASAVVAGLLAADAVLGTGLPLARLLELANELEGHPDNVAPALAGGVTVAVRGEDRLHAERLPLIDPPALVVAVPAFQLSTKDARAVLPDVVPREDAVYNVGRAALLVAALLGGRRDALSEALRDRLHEPYRRTLVPGMTEVTAAAREAGAWGVTLSGAGPSLLAWVPAERAEAVASVMTAAWAEHGVAARAWRTAIAPLGATVTGGALRPA